MLKLSGEAATVLPYNVLFEDGVSEEARKKLLKIGANSKPSNLP